MPILSERANPDRHPHYYREDKLIAIVDLAIIFETNETFKLNETNNWPGFLPEPTSLRRKASSDVGSTHFGGNLGNTAA